MECCELPHSKVLECFIKVNLGYKFLIEVVAIEHIDWIAEWPSGTWMESVWTREQ
jgi:hypothetical protein